MANYEVVYSDTVTDDDIPRLGATDRERIKSAINSKLTALPDQFGKPLRWPHSGYWVLRVGSYRIVYSISKNVVRVILIWPRDRVYEELTKRLK